MILCDHQIVRAIQEGRLEIKPVPDESQVQSSALDLRVGSDFRRWTASKRVKGVGVTIDLDSVDIADMDHHTEPLRVEHDGSVTIEPGDFVLVRTLEEVYLPLHGKLAARVEGRSKQARLGMSVHVTAPTIHAGFRGRITLEIINHGPFNLISHPNESRLCQLIIEKVGGIPAKHQSKFADQSTPLGTPKSRQTR